MHGVAHEPYADDNQVYMVFNHTKGDFIFEHITMVSE